MKNNKIYILLISLVFGLSSCNAWLDVSPDDMMEEDDLIASGAGYRAELNGIYIKMAEQSLYGQELTWGSVEAVGQIYKSSAFSSQSTYAKLRDFLFTDADVKSTMENIWTKSYHAVANSNNLIAKIESEPASKFDYGEMEKALIKGEAIALRAFLQFDILRLFAPAPIVDDNKTYIPYYDTHDSNGNPYLTVSQVLDKVIADLNTAMNLVKICDVDDASRRAWFAPDARMLTEQMIDGVMPDDVFFAYRGYRMNYYAIKALLARVYSYAGKMDLASKAASEVIAATYPNSTNEYSCFPLVITFKGDLRGYSEVIFALGRKTLPTEYATLVSSTGNSVDVELGNMYPDSEGSDIRKKDLLIDGGGRTFCKKYYTDGKKTDDMLPLIRITEMMYIVAEKLSLDGKYNEAINVIKQIRSARQIFDKGSDAISANSHEEFMKEMMRDLRKDLLLEGQYFFQRKRLNDKFDTKTLFVFEIPNNEKDN